MAVQVIIEQIPASSLVRVTIMQGGRVISRDCVSLELALTFAQTALSTPETLQNGGLHAPRHADLVSPVIAFPAQA